MRRNYLLLIFFILFFQIFFILIDRHSYYFDMKYYLNTSSVLHEAFRNIFTYPLSFGKIHYFFTMLLTGYRPSLYYIPGIILGSLWKFNAKIFVIITYLFYFTLASLTIYSVAPRNSLENIYKTAFLLFIISPQILVYGRYPMVEFPLFLIVAVTIILYLYSDSLTRSPYWQLFIIFSVAGMLIKFSYVSFVIYPVLFIAVLDSLLIIRSMGWQGYLSRFEKEKNFRILQAAFFLSLFLIGLSIFSGFKGYFLGNLHHFLRTEVAGYWSYPYQTFPEKLWWILIAPTQITTVPVLLLFILGIIFYGRKLNKLYIFILLPLIQFGFFMQSKGARLFAPVVFPICLVAAYGLNHLLSRMPTVFKKRYFSIISLFIIINMFSSVFISLDHAPAYEYPEGGSIDIFNGLTVQAVTRGGWGEDKNIWDEKVKDITGIILDRQVQKATVVHLYYTVKLPPYNQELEKKGYKQVIDELLWPEAQRFPIEVFTAKNVFIIRKTGSFTHWGEKGTGLELERNLRFLNGRFADNTSIWRKKTIKLNDVILPDKSIVEIFYRYDDLTDEETVGLYEEFLNYDYPNAINIKIAESLIEYFTNSKEPEKIYYWRSWVKNAEIHPKVIRLLSVKDIKKVNEIREKLLNN